MKADELINAWKRFTERNDFALNPDRGHVATVAKGVLENERKTGLKLCPCQLRDGTDKRDLELLCPCNFKAQPVWSSKGQCWCGLFVRRKK